MHRVLVILPLYGGSLPIGRYCATALKDLGCLVETFEAPEFYSAFQALQGLKVSSDRQNFLENSFLQVVSQAILAKVEAFQPDMVLCLAQAPMSRQALQRLRSMKVPTAMWFVEDYRLFTYWRAYAPLYDIFAVIQKEPFLAELTAAGVANPLYLPLAALPALHAPTPLDPKDMQEYGAEVSFLGAGYPNRREAFARLVHHKCKIWGTEWEDAPALAPLVQRGGARISPEDAVKIYNGTHINLNLHSSVDANTLVSGGDFVNPRTFELAACGAFQLVDKRSLMGELFAEDELATFDSMTDLEEKIPYWLAHPEEREALCRKSRTRVLADHTYQQRMRTLLDFAKEHLPEFGTRPEAPMPESIPPAMQKELQDILKEHNLPAYASFNDIITALRHKEGVLSSAETALLFLDAWNTLYASKE
ncbi:CgeB family protein [Desulfovibrio cuneatus]|uniref:CgeB family protein n=1 Tax=Desulfovibrio cuneatus TaxID=159728 RepID=UPI0003FA1FEB|nr:glycosyltransferase [Desulfovibrio cuneatus]